jgi:acyl carrier protein
VVLTSGADGTDFEVFSHLNGTIRAHARGSVAWIAAAQEQAPVLSAIKQRCSAGERAGDSQAMSRSGLITFGPHWGNLVRVHDGAGEELALLALKEDVGLDPHPWTIQPALLDEALASGWPDTTEAFLPLGYGRVVIRRRLTARLWSHLRYLDSGAADMLAADATLYDEAGNELLHVEDFYMRKADGGSIAETVAASGSQEPAGDPPGLAGEAISPATGADAFRRLVDAAITPQVVVSAVGIEAAIKVSRRADYAAVEHEGLAAGDGQQPGVISPDWPAGSPAEREAAVTEIFASLLGSHAIGRTDNFFDLGGDSLLASQIIAIVRAQLGVRIPLRRFFADPTIAGIVALIDELCATPNATGADAQ